MQAHRPQQLHLNKDQAYGTLSGRGKGNEQEPMGSYWIYRTQKIQLVKD